ncbi:flavodoxin [Collinsella sp. An2]|uniref:flavodoxin n=1 Tax=Collinsella sp. An2 TaxID=1965585 RepID=UPI000B38AC35|nr:flavodoxin [Collinsella sp. An2]OUP09172.1 flavodoxin [Collinsella sp. An2]
MSKVAVVYWSGTGNTEAMAEFVAEGVSEAGGEADVIQVSDFSASNLDDYDAFAFGCPAMGSEELESDEFEPVWDEIEPELPGRKVALFGSYDWADGEWMDLWRERAEAAGITVGDTVIAKDYPDEVAAGACRSLGAALV